MVQYIQGNLIDILLAITFGCGVIIAMMYVINGKFIDPVYDVVLNLIAFISATTASSILQHWLPAGLAFLAVIAWVVLAIRTIKTPIAQRIGQTE